MPERAKAEQVTIKKDDNSRVLVKNAKAEREGVFKLTVADDSLHVANNYNGDRAVNFATS